MDEILWVEEYHKQCLDVEFLILQLLVFLWPWNPLLWCFPLGLYLRHQITCNNYFQKIWVLIHNVHVVITGVKPKLHLFWCQSGPNVLSLSVCCLECIQLQVDHFVGSLLFYTLLLGNLYTTHTQALRWKHILCKLLLAFYESFSLISQVWASHIRLLIYFKFWPERKTPFFYDLFQHDKSTQGIIAWELIQTVLNLAGAACAGFTLLRSWAIWRHSLNFPESDCIFIFNICVQYTLSLFTTVDL